MGASAQSDQSSLYAQWVAKDPSFLHADSKDSDQTGQMPRLIWVFTEHTVTLLVLSCRGPNGGWVIVHYLGFMNIAAAGHHYKSVSLCQWPLPLYIVLLNIFILTWSWNNSELFTMKCRYQIPLLYNQLWLCSRLFTRKWFILTGMPSEKHT